jgi:hypothetical protein
VTALPAALAPWAPMLGLFPDEVAGELGRWIPRIALAIGPMRTSRPDGSGDPDGFAGLARRGSYERLLLTEWLLADEAPDEFARRAAMGEHAFFQIARRSPARAASSVGIFDTGPDQIGAPRIAGLAALIVLAERASRAGARFAWGILHDPGGALAEVVTREGVLRLLAARSAVPACEDDIAAWAERATKSGWEDAWLVGPRAPAGAAPWRHATLEVRDVLEPDRRALTLVARSPSPAAPPREIDLDLPPQAACVRLLRDPFAGAASAAAHGRTQKSAHVPASNLVFAPNGVKVFARSTEGDILSYPVPGSPHDVVGRPRRHSRPTGGVVAGAGWVARGLVTLSITNGALVFEKNSHRGPDLLNRIVPLPRGLPLAVPGPADPLSPVLCLCPEARTLVFFLDARRALFLLKADPEPRVTCIATEVAAITWFREQVAYVGRVEGGPPTRHRSGDTLPPMTVPELADAWALAIVSGQSSTSSMEVLPGDGSFEACFGYAEGGTPARSLVAVQQRGDRWSFAGDPGAAPVEIIAPEGTRVVGAWRSGATEPELVVLEADGRTLSLVGRRTSRSLPRAGAPIVDVAMSTARPHLAYVTTAGEVVIQSLVRAAPLARFAPE